jgi:hypothetical protein
VLKPGGVAICTFSNRMFWDKVRQLARPRARMRLRICCMGGLSSTQRQSRPAGLHTQPACTRVFLRHRPSRRGATAPATPVASWCAARACAGSGPPWAARPAVRPGRARASTRQSQRLVCTATGRGLPPLPALPTPPTPRPHPRAPRSSPTSRRSRGSPARRFCWRSRRRAAAPRPRPGGARSTGCSGRWQPCSPAMAATPSTPSLPTATSSVRTGSTGNWQCLGAGRRARRTTRAGQRRLAGLTRAGGTTNRTVESQTRLAGYLKLSRLLPKVFARGPVREQHAETRMISEQAARLPRRTGAWPPLPRGAWLPVPPSLLPGKCGG